MCLDGAPRAAWSSKDGKRGERERERNEGGNEASESASCLEFAIRGAGVEERSRTRGTTTRAPRQGPKKGESPLVESCSSERIVRCGCATRGGGGIAYEIRGGPQMFAK